MNSLDCSLARFSSGIMGSPYKTPGLLSQSHTFWRIPQVPCMLGASDLVSDEDVPIPRLHVSSPSALQPPSPHAPAASLADSGDEVPIPCNPSPSALLSLLHFPSHCLPSPCPAGLCPWPMPSWVWLLSTCFFFLLCIFFKTHLTLLWSAVYPDQRASAFCQHLIYVQRITSTPRSIYMSSTLEWNRHSHAWMG
jgi:hypothetical protein